MWRVLLSLAVLLVLSVEAHAYTALELLAGVKAVKVIIEDLPSDAAWCGVSEEMLRSTAILALKKNTTLSIVENAPSHVYVNLMMGRLGNMNHCVGSLRVEYNTYENVKR